MSHKFKQILCNRKIVLFIFCFYCPFFIYSQEKENSSFEKTKLIVFNDKIYQLTFEDDFNSLELDLTQWTRSKEQERSNLHGFWRNNCTYLKNGNLVIECKRDSSGELQSGGINTKNKFSQNQGLFEISFKVTKGSALWYAFWLNTDGMFKHHEKKNSIEEGFELDIFEILPGKHLISTGLHYGGYEYYDNKLVTKSKQRNISDDFYDKYHKFQLLWDEEGYKFFLDDKFLYELTSKNCGGVCYEEAYIELSAEFGSWGGELYELSLPAYMFVDYIKVYKKVD